MGSIGNRLIYDYYIKNSCLREPMWLRCCPLNFQWMDAGRMRQALQCFVSLPQSTGASFFTQFMYLLGEEHAFDFNAGRDIFYLSM